MRLLRSSLENAYFGSYPLLKDKIVGEKLRVIVANIEQVPLESKIYVFLELRIASLRRESDD